MAMMQIGDSKKDSEPKDPVKCPRCSEKVLIIDGTFIKWLTCPKCKYKKLLSNKDKPPIKVTPMMGRE